MKEKKKPKKLLFGIGILALIGITVTICYFLFYKPNQKNSLAFDDNATIGIMPGISLEERQKELQNQLDESMIAFSINTNPVFPSGTKEGNLLIENPGNNAKLLKVSIILNDTEEEIYSSNYIKPGSYIETVTLDKVLEKGIYEATAYFYAYKEDTAEYIGQTGAGISLIIEN